MAALSAFRGEASALDLTAGFIDMDIDAQALLPPSATRAEHRSGAEIVEADRDPDVRVGRREPVRRVEAYPAQRVDISLDPGVARVLLGCAVAAPQVARHVARRDVAAARGGEEDMSEV